ncbi:hypothetical protein [Peribacillus frigoritolerans]|uniref:Uncharacterized protein n=1 Tax=Peribacillus castrilensis TaxID=2897690 RepID=A0AAW9NGI8_9BACI|nr:hypothetical protein [Peribacillus castrilensis]
MNRCKNIQVQFAEGELVIRIALDETVERSQSGKVNILGTTRGFLKLDNQHALNLVMTKR